MNFNKKIKINNTLNFVVKSIKKFNSISNYSVSEVLCNPKDALRSEIRIMITPKQKIEIR